MSFSPIQIMNYGAADEKAENARLSSFIGAIAIGDLVKSTLGPKGMDKILQSYSDMNKVHVTSDGATSVTVLAAELLREAEKLITAKIHPQTVISGFRKAVAVARRTLEESA